MDLIERIVNFFTSKDYSPLSKVSWGIVVILLILGVDNYLGFSSHYRTSKKIEQIKNIEETKSNCQNNPELIKSLDELEKDILNRKDIFQHFIALFDREELKNDVDNTYKVEHPENNNKVEDFFTNLFPEMPQRSQLWHTVSSSALWILLFVGLIIYLFCLPFIQEEKKGDIVLGLLFIFIILAILTWLFQFLFGLIPVILNRAYLNYIIQILLQILIIIWLYKIGNKSKKTQN